MTRSRTVTAVVCGLALLVAACGSEDVEAVVTPTSALAAEDSQPERQSELQGEAADRARFDDAEQLFDTTVGRGYVLVFEFVSSVTAEAGPIRVDVVDGRPTDVSYPDAMTEQILPQIPMVTVEDFFDRARSVLASGGMVEAEFDEAYGYPLTMTFDPIPNAIDDEMSVVVRSVEPAEQSLETDGY